MFHAMVAGRARLISGMRMVGTNQRDVQIAFFGHGVARIFLEYYS